MELYENSLWYILVKKYKFFNWIDTQVFCFRRKFNIKRFFERITIWFSYWSVSKNVYDFDYSGVLYLEYHQLSRLKKQIQKAKSYEGYENDVKWMQTALNCLNIILNSDWYPIISHEAIMQDNRLISNKLIFDINVYINTKNYRNYFLEVAEQIKETQSFLIGLREAKAWHIYNKIREYKMQNWWD